MKTIEIYHPAQIEVTRENADAVAAGAAILASPATDTMIDTRHRRLVSALGKECEVKGGQLQQLSTRVRLAGMQPGDSLSIDFGRGIVGKYPAKHPSQALGAKLNQMLYEMAVATGRMPEPAPA